MLRDTPRDHVTAYIERVNESQEQFSTRYGSVNEAYVRFDLASNDAAGQLPRLRTSAQTLTTLRRRIASVDAPESAERLRTQLIAFLRQQEAVAWELVRVVEYLPKLSNAEQPLQRANTRLRRELTAATTPEEQAAAVSRYAATLAKVARTLEQIPPPPLLAPAHETYLRRLRAFGGPARMLDRAVAANDEAAVAAALERLRAAGEVTPRALEAQRQAIVSYNKRVNRIRELGAAVERERARLDRQLG